MLIYGATGALETNPLAKEVVAIVTSMEIPDALCYVDFPAYRDDEGITTRAEVVLMSPHHGLIVIGTTSARHATDESLRAAAESLEQTYSAVHGRLMKNKPLRKTKKELLYSAESMLYAPQLQDEAHVDALVACNVQEVKARIDQFRRSEPIASDVVNETIATLDGSKSIVAQHRREVPPDSSAKRGEAANKIEQRLAILDARQRAAALLPVNGPQRIRGIAGSGKTIVLAMKAVQLLLRNPAAKILYTFHTKSLHQHVARLIKRFYLQFAESEPDWTRIDIFYAWGGRASPGVYFNAASAAGAPFFTFTQAEQHDPGKGLHFACTTLLETERVKPIYDYVLVDEGQDFPAAFIRLCGKLAKESRLVLAYDELQTIFQSNAPSAKEIWGVDAAGEPVVDWEHDLVLQVCYRNPRPIVVCSHAIGFGIYSKRIVQMLEDEDHWNDVGYTITKGKLAPGEIVEIVRPQETAPLSMEEAFPIEDVILARGFNTIDEEVAWVRESIKADLAEGLHPEDILVICVDDRHAMSYLDTLETSMVSSVRCNNMRNSVMQDRFRVEGAVTLSTVHKAKGNEAFMVYVVGMDALFSNGGVRARNMLFTAMTRAKGWLRMSGSVNPALAAAVQEVETSRKNFPYLRFRFPSAGELKIMRRDLEEVESKKARILRMIESMTNDISVEELQEYVAKLGEDKSSKGKAPKGSPKA